MIPPLDHRGLLPPGIHACTLAVLRERFCWNAHRHKLLDGMERYLAHEWAQTGVQCPIYVDGSFTRGKMEPDDIDMVVDLTELDLNKALALALHVRQQHARVKEAYHCDLWTRHPLLPNDLLAFFQYAGDKAAAELQIPIKEAKGLLRLVL